MRAPTASATSIIGWPSSMAEMTVHLPVPFWPAASRMTSIIGVPSSSVAARISAVISTR